VLRRLAAEAGPPPWTAAPEPSRGGGGRRFQESFPSSPPGGGWETSRCRPRSRSRSRPAGGPPELRAWLDTWRRRPECRWSTTTASGCSRSRPWRPARGVGSRWPEGPRRAIFTTASVIRRHRLSAPRRDLRPPPGGATEFTSAGRSTPKVRAGARRWRRPRARAVGGYTLLRLRQPNSLIRVAARRAVPEAQPDRLPLVLLGGAAGLTALCCRCGERPLKEKGPAWRGLRMRGAAGAPREWGGRLWR